METLKLILVIIQFIMSLALVAVVLFQSGRSNSLGSIAGVADSFLSRSKATTLDGKLSKATAIGTAVYMVLTLVISLI
ncbi:MAG: preprotein translocase subunit SecG [Clostridia bacterium]|nr:preprotein translocase subunit SecG [Oscillospiraceae bacterium]MBQ2749423.1 preprotein translocase subunit SecG [Clostridia bacterium]MBQ4624450.1 preprotein translocase subunit SecG [Clostridia bacterium]MBQ6991275.1 preprotein translocase subunit SecG [Clostridia bacterium]